HLGVGRISYSTLWRWTLKGVHGVKLETLKVGRKRYTTPEALAAFGRALAQEHDARYCEAHPAAAPAPAPTERTRSDAERERAVAEARENLRRRGCLK
ncbi:MAG TPA: DUF1580 domain-containing protein, partial [Candidatus Hydrogenedentes bacterium]|nr:DUF1580 domain-containing protein [Candidatus Hydrogenedentota bacterium]